MTTEEVIELKMQQSLGIYTMSEGRKAEARLQAEIITILQKNNLNYKRASYLLNDCIALIGMAAKF